MDDGKVGTEARENPLDIAGDVIAKRMKLATLSGRDAVIFFLVHKHHWTLDFTRRLSDNDLAFLTDNIYDDSWA